LTRLALDFSNLPAADLPEVCLSLLVFSGLKFLRTQQLNLDVMSADLKGPLSLFFATNSTLKFAKNKPKFFSQETTGLGSCVVLSQ
jgi:hypothetical protein